MSPLLLSVPWILTAKSCLLLNAFLTCPLEAPDPAEGVSMQVVFTVLGAIPLFGQYPSGFFLLGAGMVTISVTMYGATAEQSAVW
jgi:hypothetical protein